MLQRAPQINPHAGPKCRADQRTGAAHDGLDDELPRGLEIEGVGRHIALEQAEQPAGQSPIGRRDDEGGELVFLHVMAQYAGAQGILTDRHKNGAERRLDDAARQQKPEEKQDGN